MMNITSQIILETNLYMSFTPMKIRIRTPIFDGRLIQFIYR